MTRPTIRDSFDVQFCFLCLLILTSALSGCKNRDQQRIDFAKRSVAYNMPFAKDSPLHKEIRDRMLTLLDKTNRRTIRVPKIGAAAPGRFFEQSGVVIWWVESKPSVDGLAIRAGDDGAVTYERFTATESDFNTKESERTIVFSCVVPLSPELFKRLQSRCKIDVALTRHRDVVSAWVPVMSSDIIKNGFAKASSSTRQ